KEFIIPEMREIQSKELREKLIELHTYSTTVTEGNTATEEDVEKVFGNYPVKLTPREITEILNAREAVEHLYRNGGEEITLREIRRLHEILMKGLVEKPGRFHYDRKRIIGSEAKLPQSKDEIQPALQAMLNFHHEYKGEIDARILSAIIHFIFVTIHPFADGNGRAGRLLHSWILLKEDLPLFVFDPNRKNEYFELLEAGRKNSLDGFIEFCLAEHARALESIT
ncbi:MAG: Fic family protein, partial [Candidatus Altiarchaeota archaeon]|nr:Fic family protein [Candidatus Altiarchaeota archaeon]